MLSETPLLNVRQTGAEMARLAVAFREDMLPYANLGPQGVFDLLSGIPYHADPDSVEFLQRPYYTLSRSGGGGDCDDKAICVGAWASLNRYPFRFVAVSKSKAEPLHHVFAEIKIAGAWVPFDCTYVFNTLGAQRNYAQREVIWQSL